uniref:Phosphatidic acid phosphatase type 2/haloperoxidase domain-containing protein n=1 Tax=viral metagenome TaxID=1070528 RepID=A0A6C0EZW3_9ZZZZ
MSVSLIDTIKIFINTLVRITPVGLYAGSAMSGIVFNDFRGLLLFGGFIGNELLGLGYKMVLHGVSNPQCALTYSETGTPFVLPSPISQTIGFFLGFFFMDMYYENTFSPLKFFVLTFLQLITIYSRMNVGCKTLLDAVYCSLIGLLFGVVYYSLVQPYYKADYLNETLTEASNDINNFFSIN